MSRKDRLRSWILEHGQRVDATSLRDDTPLLEQRILSSLQIAELLLFLEELREKPVDLEGLTGGSFRDLASMCKAFELEDARA